MLLHNLNTERLRFRNLELADARTWEEFLSDSDATKFFPIITDVKKSSAEWMEKTLKRYAGDGFGFYGLIRKDTDEFIGQCGLLTQKVNGRKELEIAYHILPRFWNRGYATEAAIACRNFAFARMNFFQDHDLSASTISLIVPENFNSLKVAEKNGMKKEREIEWNGKKYFIYRITQDEWKQLNSRSPL